jgi:hypothetical protein
MAAITGNLGDVLIGGIAAMVAAIFHVASDRTTAYIVCAFSTICHLIYPLL